jgi:hypothetical protein
MARPEVLAGVAAAHAVANVAALAVAVRRRRPYRLPGMQGSPDHVARDSIWMGTAYSTPLPMFAAQVWAAARLSRGPDELARRVVGGLGTAMVPGYLMEHWSREHLRRRDPVETPVVVVGLGLAAAMAVLGGLGLRGQSRGMRRS